MKTQRFGQGFWQLACALLLLMSFSGWTLAETGAAAKSKKTEQYYQCKDLRGRISLQQTPCAGTGVSQTEIEVDGSPKLSTSNDSVMASAHLGAASTLMSSVNVDQQSKVLVEKLQKARRDKPVVLVGLVLLAMIAVWYGLVLIYLAFCQSIWWGLAYLFIPVAGLVYVVIYWHDTSKPFLINISCGFMAGVVAYIFL